MIDRSDFTNGLLSAIIGVGIIMLVAGIIIALCLGSLFILL